MDIPSKFQWFHSIKNDISGAFFEFSENSRKGHRFFYWSFQKIIILFLR